MQRKLSTDSIEEFLSYSFISSLSNLFQTVQQLPNKSSNKARCLSLRICFPHGIIGRFISNSHTLSQARAQENYCGTGKNGATLISGLERYLLVSFIRILRPFAPALVSPGAAWGTMRSMSPPIVAIILPSSSSGGILYFHRLAPQKWRSALRNKQYLE